MSVKPGNISRKSLSKVLRKFVKNFERLQYHYYLFYDMGERSFHTPINEMDVEKYPELKVVTIDQIITYGNEILELASTQFVKKVIALIQSGQYQYKDAA